MPFERDEGEYAYAGQLIMQGIPPYELAYNMKLPGTYYMCALGMTFFGQTIAGIHATLMVVNSLAVLFVFLLGRKLFGVTSGLVAASSYAFMSVSPIVYGMAAHANQFVVLFAVPATLLLWRGSAPARAHVVFFSGLLYGLAFLMKQQGVFFGAFGGFYLVYLGIKNRNLRGLFKDLVCYGLGIFAPFVCLCLVLLRAGVFSRFWFWTFTYAHSYVSMASWHLGFRWLYLHLESSVAYTTALWFLAVLGLVLGATDRMFRERTIFVAALWLFSFFGTATGLYFRGHYFILVLPAFCLLLGLAVVILETRFSWRMGVNLNHVIPSALFALALGWSIYYQRDYFFRMPGDLITQVIYANCPFIQTQMVSEYIRTHCSPNDRIAVMGSEPQIYFYTQRHSATGFIYTYPLMELQPNASYMQQQMISEIESVHPKYMVWVSFPDSWLIRPTSDMTIIDWCSRYLKKDYDMVGVVKTSPNGLITYYWDEAVKDLHGSLGATFIAVYKSRGS